MLTIKKCLKIGKHNKRCHFVALPYFFDFSDDIVGLDIFLPWPMWRGNPYHHQAKQLSVLVDLTIFGAH
jgi:hypothetical protein